MSVNAEELLKLVVPLVAATSGAAWGAVKLALNGTRKAIADSRKEAAESFEKVHEGMRRMEDKVSDVRERVAHLEGIVK